MLLESNDNNNNNHGFTLLVVIGVGKQMPGKSRRVCYEFSEKICDAREQKCLFTLFRLPGDTIEAVKYIVIREKEREGESNFTRNYKPVALTVPVALALIPIKST